jgi:hypothetical protein
MVPVSPFIDCYTLSSEPIIAFPHTLLSRDYCSHLTTKRNVYGFTLFPLVESIMPCVRGANRTQLPGLVLSPSFYYLGDI